MDIQKVLTNIGFDWRVALANLVNFLIIFYLLKRFAFRPIQRVLSARRLKIDEGLENAEKAKTELMMAKEVAARELSGARLEANEILAAARNEGQTIVVAARNRAAEEGEKIVQTAERQIEKDRARMELELRRQTIDLVVAGLEKILPGELDKKKRELIISQLTK